jgi:hypothetical protein
LSAEDIPDPDTPVMIATETGIKSEVRSQKSEVRNQKAEVDLLTSDL